LTYIEIEAEQSYLNLSKVFKLIKTRTSGKSTVPDRWTVEAIMENGTKEFIRAFESEDECMIWMNQTFKILTPEPGIQQKITKQDPPVETPAKPKK